MTPIEALLARLPGAKRNGSGWQSRCPAHDDRQPSLSISNGDGGRALVCCHAGCTAEAIVQALGLTLRDLMPKAPPPPPLRNAPPPPRKNPARPVFASAADAVAELERQHGPRSACWTYVNENNQPVGVVMRWDRPNREKEIRPVSRDGTGWVIGGMKTPRPLYCLPELGAVARIYIAEGEKAADAMRSVGLVATTSPHGAKSAAMADWSVLAGKDCVLAPDNDDAGRAYASAVTELLSKLTPPAIVRVLELPGLPLGGDFVEFLEARDGRTADEIRAEVEALVATVEPIRTPPSTAPPSASPLIVRLEDVVATPVHWLWPGRIALGKITVVPGDPGLGKSFLSLDMAARVSTGSGWPDLPGQPFEPGGVVLLSAEDDLADTIRPRLDAAGADVSRITALRAVRRVDPITGKQTESPFCLSTDLEALEQAIKATPDCRLVVVDPVSAYLGSTESHTNAAVRGVLAPLAELAGKYGVAVIAITHLRKGEGPAMYRAMGSLAFVAAARAVWAVARDPDDPTGRRRLFLPVKNNLGSDMNGLAYVLSAEHSSNGRPVVQWDATPVSLTADEALSHGFDRSSTSEDTPDAESAVDEASAWLRGLLGSGPVASTKVKSAARDDGLSWTTVRRAKDVIGAKAMHVGFGSGGVWAWYLPSAKGAQEPPIDSQPESVSAYGADEHLCDPDVETPPGEAS